MTLNHRHRRRRSKQYRKRQFNHLRRSCLRRKKRYDDRPLLFANTTSAQSGTFKLTMSHQLITQCVYSSAGSSVSYRFFLFEPERRAEVSEPTWFIWIHFKIQVNTNLIDKHRQSLLFYSNKENVESEHCVITPTITRKIIVATCYHYSG